jgi:hypothetical protein
MLNPFLQQNGQNNYKSSLINNEFLTDILERLQKDTVFRKDV